MSLSMFEGKSFTSKSNMATADFAEEWEMIEAVSDLSSSYLCYLEELLWL